jgi:hypothetical protein
LARNGDRSAGKRALIWPEAPARHARQPCEGGSEPTGEPSASAEPATAAMALEALGKRWPRKSSQAAAATLLLLRDSASVALPREPRSVRHLRRAPFPAWPGLARPGRVWIGMPGPRSQRATKPRGWDGPCGGACFVATRGYSECVRKVSGFIFQSICSMVRSAVAVRKAGRSLRKIASALRRYCHAL